MWDILENYIFHVAMPFLTDFFTADVPLLALTLTLTLTLTRCVMRNRWFVIAEYLQRHSWRYRHVLMSDTKDAVLQADPVALTPTLTLTLTQPQP